MKTAVIYTRVSTEEQAKHGLSSIQNDHTDKVKILNDLLSLSENIYTSYIRADSILKRKYLRMFFEGIYVDNKEIIEVIYTPAISQLLEIDRVRITNNWRELWNNFRNSPWHEYIKTPELFIQNAKELLATVGVKYNRTF